MGEIVIQLVGERMLQFDQWCSCKKGWSYMNDKSYAYSPQIIQALEDNIRAVLGIEPRLPFVTEAEMPETKVNPGNDIELQLPQPEEQSKTEPIVYLRNAYKYYGTKRKPLVVLDGLNMTVSKGIIYGLLGASGCGKTTLLSCILGLKTLNSGQVCVFGATPGTESSGVPGLRLGYMPQETALYGDFSIRESFEYFGKIAKIGRKQVKEQLQKLTKLLMLPKTNQRVNTLSGGEQRRVSFAIVLLHEPELLILDEPTVGLDPILREDIWNHLVKICKENGTAIIMTTHYIEEARQAHMVALMRGGRLLAEDPPTNLLAYYGAANLEEVFLTLSIKQSEDRAGFGAIQKEDFPSTSSASLKKTDRLEDMGSSMSPLSDYKASTTKGYNLLSMKGHHLSALLWKNALWWKRNVPTLMFALWISILVVALGCLCIGSDPRDLSVAVVNYETNNSLNCSSLTCSSPHISCHYLEYLKNQSINLVYYTTEDEVKQSVLQGNTYASIIIRHNYTDALRFRINNWRDSEPWDIEYSNIDVFRDVSNQQIKTYLEIRLYEAFRNFFKDYLQACDLSPKFLDIPINWKVPVFGILNPSIMDAVFPGTLLAMMFILAVILTSLVVLVDRNEATFERTLVMGITTTELIVTHVISEFLITMVQAILSVFTAFTFFNVVHEGSTVLVVLLTMLMGFCGVCYGVLISSVCDTIMAVNLMTLGTCIPTLFLCGSVWPVEAVHYLLRPVAVILPITRGFYSMKNILQKDWDLYSSDVYMGFVYIFLWAFIFLALANLQKEKQSNKT